MQCRSSPQVLYEDVLARFISVFYFIFDNIFIYGVIKILFFAFFVYFQSLAISCVINCGVYNMYVSSLLQKSEISAYPYFNNSKYIKIFHVDLFSEPSRHHHNESHEWHKIFEISFPIDFGRLQLQNQH